MLPVWCGEGCGAPMAHVLTTRALLWLCVPQVVEKLEGEQVEQVKTRMAQLHTETVAAQQVRMCHACACAPTPLPLTLPCAMVRAASRRLAGSDRGARR